MRQETHIEMRDGQRLYAVLYEPDGPVKAHVQIVHGMGEHIGRYESFAHHLAARQVIVTGYDQRGHGKTAVGGARGIVDARDGLAGLAADAADVLAHFRARTEGVPTVLFGHSMGSFVARLFLQEYGDRIQGAVLSGTGGRQPAALVAAGRALAASRSAFHKPDRPDDLLHRLLFGRFEREFRKAGHSGSWLTSDAQEAAAYEGDADCGFAYSSRFYADLLAAQARLADPSQLARMPKALPVLLISGALDIVGDFGRGVLNVARQFEQAGLADVEVHLQEAGRHELLNDVQREQAADVVVDWIASHVDN